MAKYLMLWEVDQSKVPIAPQERGAGWSGLMNMVKQDMEKGLTKDWGAFIGELRGYSIAEGSELEIMKSIQQYIPFVTFKLHQIASVSQVDEMIKALSS
jgi:hypothetical protein